MSKTNPSTLQRPKQPMPGFVRKALEQRSLMDAYRERPPYQQNDYLMWINQAKLEDTKQKRLAQMLEELAGRSKYMNMDWHPPKA
jgi:uncharacterized protein YdeI (YjbR/CyaY-like superfamily)